jgi:hypothetical protein
LQARAAKLGETRAQEAVEPLPGIALIGFRRQARDFVRHEMSVTGDSETSPTADSETLPGTVFTPRQVRILKIAVIAMGILLVGGFAFVLAAIVYQASRPAQDKSEAGAALLPGQGTLSRDLPIPLGATVTSLALDGNRLAVTLGGAEPELMVIDLASGAIVARLRLKPQ